MTLLATVGGWVWLGPAIAGAWAAAVVTLMIVNRLSWRWIESVEQPGSGMRQVLAGLTFLYTATYCALPAVMITQGTGASPLVGGVSMIIAIALSATSEVVISRRIGGMALAALFAASVLIVLEGTTGEAWPDRLFAMLAMAALYACILQFAMHRVRADRMTRAAVAEAEAANAAKSVFLASMSHEIRTPLNGVLGMAQAMAADDLSIAQRERLDLICESGEVLTTILNDVLDLSKVEAGKLELASAPFDLGEMLRSAVQPFKVLASERTLTLSLDIEPEAEGVYRGDRARLRQVLTNLISNAVKFTDAGTIWVSLRREGPFMHFAVADSGPGIAPDQIGKLFAKFAQLDASSTRRHGGTGLGLAISRELCTLMGGEIGVESRLGRGSIFTVVLPLERLGEVVEAPVNAAAAAEPADFPPLRVLAAEDNRINQIVLSTLLGQIGVTPSMVGDGAAAVAAWEAQTWDVILMDIHMPVLDGVEAVKQIRAAEARTGRPRTPVIALTANAMTHQVEALLAAGMDRHVAKPIDAAVLFNAIESVLEEIEAPAQAATG